MNRGKDDFHGWIGLWERSKCTNERRSSHDGTISSFELSCQIFFDQLVLFRSVTSPNFWSRDFSEVARNFRIVLVRSWILNTLLRAAFSKTKKPNSFLPNNTHCGYNPFRSSSSFMRALEDFCSFISDITESQLAWYNFNKLYLGFRTITNILEVVFFSDEGHPRKRLSLSKQEWPGWTTFCKSTTGW